jgi:hypothetical protein
MEAKVVYRYFGIVMKKLAFEEKGTRDEKGTWGEVRRLKK